MSKARLIITALLLEQESPAQIAARYSVHRSWVYKLKARYLTEGDTALEPKSRRPKNSPTAISRTTIEQIVQLRQRLTSQGLDAGPDTIAWHLRHHHNTTVSAATISRYLTKAGLVKPEPNKRPKASYIRFQAHMPNQTWQSDFTHYPLTDGTDTEILSWIDDCTRYAIGLTAHRRISTPIIVAEFRNAYTRHGIPASTLTDNGMVYTVRLAGLGRRGGRNAFEAELRRLNITQKNGQPNHPTTQGKVERFQQTLKKWLRSHPNQPATIEALQTLLNTFTDEYNHHRPHRSLPHRATPAALFDTMPKDLPHASTDPTNHNRIRHDRVDKTGSVTLRVNGKLHHIGIGRTHARTHVIMLTHDLDVVIAAAATGELLRELTIDPSRDYQPIKPTQ